MSAVRFEPTEADLRHAWQHCKRSARTPWPATYEEAMADDTLSRMVRLTAMHPPKAHRKPATPAKAPNVVFTSGAARPLTTPPERRFFPVIDRKRAAAGDRDDD